MHAISSYRGNRPTNKQSHTLTDRTDYNTLRVSYLARSVIKRQLDANAMVTAILFEFDLRAVRLLIKGH